MPANSNIHSEWSSERYLNWAKNIGPSTHLVIQRHFERVKVEQQKYRMVHSILKLAGKYGNHRLELACQHGLGHLRCPNYKNIKLILDNMQEVNGKDLQKEEKPKFLRGGNYFG